MRTIETTAFRLPVEGELPEFLGAITWLNSAPLTPADLRGKVVLVNFWTFTCINWLRQLPYIRAWAAKYKDQGLVVVGVHTPEFAFERDVGSVRRSAIDMNIDYPVVVDNGHEIWRAFGNQYWPALYFVDVQGRIRHHHFGEGDYGRSEHIIQQLLSEVGTGRGDQSLVAVNAHGVEAAADWSRLRSSETYLGYERASSYQLSRLRPDLPTVYSGTTIRQVGEWSLAGRWTVGHEFVALHDVAGRIGLRFHARDLHLVLAPSIPGRLLHFRVTLDGRPPGASRGVDIDADGVGLVHMGRLYQLIRQTGSVEDRTFEIEFLDPGVRAYAFTFG